VIVNVGVGVGVGIQLTINVVSHKSASIILINTSGALANSIGNGNIIVGGTGDVIPVINRQLFK